MGIGSVKKKIRYDPRPARCTRKLVFVEDLNYIRSPSKLRSIQERTTELQFSMASEPLVGAMLRMLAASKPGGRFLELGTGTGIATAWLLEGMDAASTLVSVDNDRAVQQVARDSLGADGRLTLD